jgi:hypothetical protein
MIRLVNVQTFREQPSRRRTQRVNGFDQLTITLLGPTSSVNQWTPTLGSPHISIDPDGYPNMFCTSCQELEKAGALCEIQVSYTGFMYINDYYPQPVVQKRIVENTGSYQVADSLIVNPGTPKFFLVNYGQFGVPNSTNVNVTPVWRITGYVGRIIKVGTYTIAIRYLSTQAVITYHTLSNPGKPIQSGLASPIVQYEIISQDRSTLSGSNSVDGVPPLSVTADWEWKMVCSSFDAVPVTPNCFECHETWEMQIISSVIWSDIYGEPTLLAIGNDQSGASGDS